MERVRALLRLARDQKGTPEGRLAARLAEDLAARFRIVQDEVRAEADQPHRVRIWPGGPEDRGESCSPGGPTYWKRVLLTIVATYYEVVAVHATDGWSEVLGDLEGIRRALRGFEYARDAIEAEAAAWEKRAQEAVKRSPGGYVHAYTTTSAVTTGFGGSMTISFVQWQPAQMPGTAADFAMSAIGGLIQRFLEARRPKQGFYARRPRSAPVCTARATDAPFSSALLPVLWTGSALVSPQALADRQREAAYREARRYEQRGEGCEAWSSATQHRPILEATQWALGLSWPPPDDEKDPGV